MYGLNLGAREMLLAQNPAEHGTYCSGFS